MSEKVQPYAKTAQTEGKGTAGIDLKDVSLMLL